MQLVIVYDYGDGCTYYATDTRAVEYDSAEAFAVGLEAAWHQAALNNPYGGDFTFAGKIWNLSQLGDGSSPCAFCLPDILTVDQWFAGSARGNYD